MSHGVNTMKADEAYSARYGGYFDWNTKEWILAVCDDKDCPYCKNRPATAHGLADDTAPELQPKAHNDLTRVNQ